MNSKRYIGAGLILAAMLPLSNGSELLSAQRTFMQESIQRNAIVVDHTPEGSGQSGKTNRAVFSVVQFQDADGTRRTVRTNVSSYPAPSIVGDEMNVRVHNTRPNDVRVATFTGLWLESTFYLVPGFLTLLAGLMLVWKSKTT